PASQRRHPFLDGATFQALPLAHSTDRGEARHADSLASKEPPSILEMEISALWPITRSLRSPAINRGNGNQQSDTGEERIANELLLKIGIQTGKIVRSNLEPSVPTCRGTPSVQPIHLNAG